MKRFLSCLFTFMVVFGVVFAQEVEDEAVSESTGAEYVQPASTEQKASAEKDSSVVIAPGLSFSVFGLEPSVLIGVNHAEFLIGCGIQTFIQSQDSYIVMDFVEDSSNTDENPYVFALTPKLHIGYNFNGYDHGYQSTLGMAIASSLAFREDNMENMDAIALYYRGGLKFHSGFEVGFTTYLPFFAVEIDEDGVTPWSITEGAGFFTAFGAGFVSTSLNFRWFF